ncbi:MAG TPA: GntR family transcriptional regulator [Shinella sp.]|jgi:DNA-binding GntR family transcriptional regulator|uniref:GntR family transcriptional regulator n=1 Tax=Shinella sp. TaxID=1870904 RepID=UPI002E13115E|nr:GntR family transcriptional regulator [Shinella sp.]
MNDAGPKLFQRVAHETMSGQVYEEIRRVIMGGLLEPGSVVSIRGLADQLGTSMMPVRDALRRLLSERILEMDGPRRFRLKALSKSEFKEILSLRESLEGALVEQAVAKISAADIEKLSELQDGMEHSVESMESFLKLNQEFHFIIYAAANRPVTLNLIESLWLQVGPMLNYYIVRNGGQIAVHHHRTLIDALQRRDAFDARAAILADLRDAAKVILDEADVW